MSEGDVTGTDVQARAWPRGFGIVGSGVIASIHAEAIASLPAARLAAVTDVVPESATSLARTFGCAAEPDLDALLARDDVDVVSVCVPSGLHADVGVGPRRRASTSWSRSPSTSAWPRPTGSSARRARRTCS
jgi:hypothetical protein